MRSFIIVTALLMAAPVAAQGTQPFVDCAAKLADAERLACYDKAVEAASADARRIAETRRKAAAEAALVTAAAEKAAAEAKQRDRFGREGVRAFRDDDDGEAQQVTAAVTEALRDQIGKVVLILDNGQMWRQVDGFALPGIKPGTIVTVQRGAMGSYRVKLAGSARTAQVVRMR